MSLPFLLGNAKFYCRVYKSAYCLRPETGAYSPHTPHHIPFRSLSKHHFPTFLPRSSMESLSFRYSYQTSVYICLLSHPNHKHRPSQPRTFDRPDVGRGEQITKFLVMQLFTHRPFAAYFVGPNINILDNSHPVLEVQLDVHIARTSGKIITL